MVEQSQIYRVSCLIVYVANLSTIKTCVCEHCVFHDGAKFESTCLDELDYETGMKWLFYSAHGGYNCTQFL